MSILQTRKRRPQKPIPETYDTFYRNYCGEIEPVKVASFTDKTLEVIEENEWTKTKRLTRTSWVTSYTNYFKTLGEAIQYERAKRLAVIRDCERMIKDAKSWIESNPFTP